MHGLADVHHGVEDDRVSGWLHLVSAGDKHSQITFFFSTTNTFAQRQTHFFLIIAVFLEVLLYEDLHDGPADLHPHTVLLEHVQEWQETLLGKGNNRRNC